MSGNEGLAGILSAVKEGFDFKRHIANAKEEDELAHRERQSKIAAIDRDDAYQKAVQELGIRYGYLQPKKKPGEIPADAGIAAPAAPAAPAPQPGDVVPEGANGTQTAAVAPPVGTQGDWKAINASARATQPARNAEQIALLQQELANEQNPANRAALQREIARFGGPADAAQVATPAAQGVAPVRQQQADPLSSTNKTMNYALERAQLDIAHGKKDGAGLITLQKTIDAFKREKMDDAIKLLHQGRFDEASDVFSTAGDHRDWKVVSAQNGVFKVGNTDVPTRIVTVQAENGQIRTINTAEALYTRQEMDKVMAQAQKERELSTNEKKADAEVKRDDAYAKYLDKQGNAAKNQTLSGKIEDMETALGRKLTADERETALGLDKLPALVRGQVTSLQKEQENTQKAIDKAMADGTWQPDSPGAKALQERQAATQMKLNKLIEPYANKDGKKDKADPFGLRKEGDGKGDSTDNPFQDGGDAKPAKKPAAAGGLTVQKEAPPEYTAPPDSPAGKFQSRVAQAKADAEAMAKKVQTGFAGDVAALKPEELLKKYNDQRGLLTPAQRIQLNKAERKI